MTLLRSRLNDFYNTTPTFSLRAFAYALLCRVILTYLTDSNFAASASSNKPPPLSS